MVEIRLDCEMVRMMGLGMMLRELNGMRLWRIELLPLISLCLAPRSTASAGAAACEDHSDSPSSHSSHVVLSPPSATARCTSASISPSPLHSEHSTSRTCPSAGRAALSTFVSSTNLLLMLFLLSRSLIFFDFFSNVISSSWN